MWQWVRKPGVLGRPGEPGGQRQQAVTAAQLASFPHPPDIAHNCNQIPLRLAGQTSLVDIAIFHNELIVMN